MNIGRYVMVMSVIFEGIKRHVDLCTFIMLNADLQIMVISIAPRVLRGTTTCIGAITCFLFVEKFKNKFHLSIVLRAIPWPRLCIFAGKCHKKYGSCGPYYRRLYKCIIFLPYITLEFHTLLNLTSIITLSITRRGDDASNFKRRVFGYL